MTKTLQLQRVIKTKKQQAAGSLNLRDVMHAREGKKPTMATDL